MTPSRLKVRQTAPGDNDALLRIHAETWVATYVGQVPDELARARLATARERDWGKHAELRARAGGGVLVLLDDGVVAGFCEFGPTQDSDDDARRVGHIMRLYVHPQHQGHGGGRLLIESACAYLARNGFVEATLWTLEAASNLAHGFYTTLGWTIEGTRNDEMPPDVRYRRRLP